MQISLGTIFDADLDRRPLIAGIRYGAGWHRQEAHDWSCQQQATLWIDPIVHPQGHKIELEVVCFGASPMSPAKLTTSLGQVFEVVSCRPFTLSFDMPAAREGGEIAFTFGLNRLHAPSILGVAADDRRLGLRILQARAFDRSIALPLYFSNPQAAELCLLEGWAAQEPTGRWSIGAEAILTLPAALRPEKGKIALVLRSLGRPKKIPSLGVSLWAGDDFIQHFKDFDPNGASLELEVEKLWQPNSPLTLRLQFEHLRSPQELGVNADPRPLGIFLMGIEHRV